MSDADVHATLDRLARGWSTHDVDLVVSCFSPDCVYEDVAVGLVLQGRDALRAWASELISTIPDFEYEETARLVSPIGAAIEYWLRGTPASAPEGQPSSGRRGEVRCATVLELRDGLITQNRDYWDRQTLVAQVAGE